MATKTLSRHWFTIVALILGTIYSSLMFFYKTDVAAITAIYATVMISAFTFWAEKREAEVAAENQLTAILARHAFSKLKNFIWRKRIEDILDRIEELDGKFLTLNEDEIEGYTKSLLQSLSTKRTPNKYFATHIVNDPVYLEVWGQNCPYYKDMEDFVQPQKNILNNNGEVIRIFIFTPDFLKQNFDQCVSMLKFHDSYYENSKRNITTLCYIAKATDSISHDITIVNDEFVFEWYRSLNGEYGYSGGKCFIESDKTKLINDFQKIKSKAFVPEKLGQYR